MWNTTNDSAVFFARGFTVLRSLDSQSASPIVTSVLRLQTATHSYESPLFFKRPAMSDQALSGLVIRRVIQHCNHVDFGVSKFASRAKRHSPFGRRLKTDKAFPERCLAVLPLFGVTVISRRAVA